MATSKEYKDFILEQLDLQEQIPYENAKPMYFVDDVDSKELLKEIVIDTCKGLLIKK